MSSSTLIDKIISKMRRRLQTSVPIQSVHGETAGVAAIFKGNPLQLLLIERAQRQGDPWSGQVAFPGGRVQAQDTNFMETAARETREEVGLDLRKDSRFLGYTGPFQGKNNPVRVVTAVFEIDGDPHIVPNEEVKSYRWAQVSDLLSKDGRWTYVLKIGGTNLTFPALRYQSYVIWGLTERMISKLLGAEGNRDPDEA